MLERTKTVKMRIAEDIVHRCLPLANSRHESTPGSGPG
jgi:hypothetical protein